MGKPAEAFTYGDDVVANDPGMLRYAKELKLVAPLPDTIDGERLTAEEAVVLSFNRHPVVETTVAGLALAGLGVAAGAVVFSRRRS